MVVDFDSYLWFDHNLFSSLYFVVEMTVDLIYYYLVYELLIIKLMIESQTKEFFIKDGSRVKYMRFFMIIIRFLCGLVVLAANIYGIFAPWPFNFLICVLASRTLFFMTDIYIICMSYKSAIFLIEKKVEKSIFTKKRLTKF